MDMESASTVADADVSEFELFGDATETISEQDTTETVSVKNERKSLTPNEIKDVRELISREKCAGRTIPLANIMSQTPPCFLETLETMVKNGDCLLACFVVLLECLVHGHVPNINYERPAKAMRKVMVDYIRDEWESYPIFNPYMKVHELITMTHDVPEERADADTSWGETPEEQLQSYLQKCDALYFSDVEMLLFSCMMFERCATPIVFRTWRSVSRKEPSEFISLTPEPDFLRMNDVTDAYIIDLQHSGAVDGSSAHYKIIQGGSLGPLLDVKEAEEAVCVDVREPPPKKRQRLTKTADLMNMR